jgi:hypothetical protein
MTLKLKPEKETREKERKKFVSNKEGKKYQLAKEYACRRMYDMNVMKRYEVYSRMTIVHKKKISFLKSAPGY